MSPSIGMENPDAFRDVVANLPAALYTTDAQGRITYFNDAAASFWGRSPVLGQDMWCGSLRLYQPDGSLLPHEACPMAVTVKTGKPVRGAEAVAERPDGTRVAFTPFPTPLFDARGELTGAVNILVEITGRSQAKGDAQRVVARDLATAALFEQVARMIQLDSPGVSATQWAILRYLARTRRERTAAQIAGYLGVAETGVARDVSVLVRHGLLIGGSETAGGARHFKLGEQGRAALQIDPVKRLARAMGRLSDAQRTSLAQGLETVAGHLARDDTIRGRSG